MFIIFGDDSLVINDIRMDECSLCLILDYEKLLADVILQAMINVKEAAKLIANVRIPKKFKKTKSENILPLIVEKMEIAQGNLIIR